MPVIPRYQADLMQRSDSPAKVTDTDVARIQGAAIAHFGKGVSDVGEVIAAQENARKKQRNLNDLTLHSSVLEDIRSQEITNAQSPAVPADQIVNTYKTGYEKKSSDYLKGIQVSDDVRAMLESKRFQVGLDPEKLKSLYDKQTVAENDKFTREANEIKSKYTSSILIDPSLANKKTQEYSDYIKNGALKGNHDFIMKGVKKEFSDAALQGLINNAGRSDDIRVINKNYRDIREKFAEYAPNYEPDELIKKYEEINSSREKALDLRLKLDKEEVSLGEKQDKKLKDSQYTSLNKKLIEIQNMPDSAEKLKAMADFEKMVRETPEDSLEPGDMNRLLGDLKTYSSDNSEDLLNTFKSKAYDTKNYTKLREEIRKSRMIPRHKDEAEAHLEKIRDKKNRRSRRVTDKTDAQTKKMLLDNFKYRGFGTEPQSKITVRANIALEWEALKGKPEYQGPSGRQDLYKFLLKKHSGIEASVIPEVIQKKFNKAKTKDELEIEYKDATKKFMNKELTPKEYRAIKDYYDQQKQVMDK